MSPSLCYAPRFEQPVRDPMQISVDDQDEVATSYICHALDHINSSGLWFGDDPLAFSVPLLLLQLSLISIFTRSIYFLLKPFGQPSIFFSKSQKFNLLFLVFFFFSFNLVLRFVIFMTFLMFCFHQGGVVLGPSIIGCNSKFATKVFQPKGKALVETLSVFGFMPFMYLIGVKMDPNVVLKSGKRTIAIGFLAFSIPYVLAGFIAFLFQCPPTRCYNTVLNVLPQYCLLS